MHAQMPSECLVPSMVELPDDNIIYGPSSCHLEHLRISTLHGLSADEVAEVVAQVVEPGVGAVVGSGSKERLNC